MINSWQKITRVYPENPFGRGSTDITFSSSQTFSTVYKSCSGSAGSSTLSLSSFGFTDGDLILIHQTRGTGAGQWEINRIVSGGGTTSLMLQESLHYTYTDSGDSQAQVIKIQEYRDFSINSGVTLSVSGWNGDTGGFIPIAVKNDLVIDGTISVSGGGYRGGVGKTTTNDSDPAGCGESALGPSNTDWNSGNNSNGAGGSGGKRYYGSANATNAGGGGHGTSGTDGDDYRAIEGTTDGSSDLTDLVFGGAGGGALISSSSGSAGAGGNGGGALIIFAKNVDINGYIYSKGNNGGYSSTSDSEASIGRSAGGAGGSVLICGYNLDIGTDLIQTIGGSTGGSGGGREAFNGGSGGKGRIAIYYNKPLNGSVSSTYYGTLTTEQDTSLRPPIKRTLFI